jgi:PKD repeat protein
VITAGAVSAGNMSCDSNTLSEQIEPYSSEGPLQYGTTSGQTPGTRQKPDLVAPDGVATTGVGGFNEPFCGTSAAGPHIAGLLALLGPAYPGQVPFNLLKQYANQLTENNAFGNGTGTPNGVFGYGLPNLAAMLTAGAYPPPTATISAPNSSASITAGSNLQFGGACNLHGASAATTLDWNFGSGSGIADSNLATPLVTFNTAGTFTVTMSCTNSLGKGSASIAVTVNPPPSKGGGGLGLLEVMGLLSLLAVARERSRRQQRYLKT